MQRCLSCVPRDVLWCAEEVNIQVHSESTSSQGSQRVEVPALEQVVVPTAHEESQHQRDKSEKSMWEIVKNQGSLGDEPVTPTFVTLYHWGGLGGGNHQSKMLLGSSMVFRSKHFCLELVDHGGYNLKRSQRERFWRKGRGHCGM